MIETSLYSSVEWRDKREHNAVMIKSMVGKYHSVSSKETSLYQSFGHVVDYYVGSVLPRTIAAQGDDVSEHRGKLILEYMTPRDPMTRLGLIEKQLLGTIFKPIIPYDFVVKHLQFEPKKDLRGVYGTPFDRIEDGIDRREVQVLRPRRFPATHTPKMRETIKYE